MISQGQLFQYAEMQALNACFLRVQSPPPANTYLALSQTTVGSLDQHEMTMAGTTINEYPPGTGYARQLFGPSAPSAASPSQIWNSAAITFGPFTSGPGTCFWALVCDALTGPSANAIASFLLGTSRTPSTGDSLTGAAGTGVAGVGFIFQV